jgi:hypothetical protein
MCVSYACTTPNICEHVMKASPIFKIAQSTIDPLRWGWDFNHWVPLMSCFPLHRHMHNHRMFNIRPTNPKSLLNRLSTSSNRSMIFYRKPMLSTNNFMINIRYRTSFRWETRYGCIYRKSTLQDPIRSFVHFVMDLTPSPRLWVTMILS